MQGRRVRVALAAAAMISLMMAGGTAQAQSFDNDSLVDINFGYEQATSSIPSLDYNEARFVIQDGDGDFSTRSYRYSRYFYSDRTIAGSLSTENDDGTKRVLVEWMMSEPDRAQRSSRGALVIQNKYLLLRVVLYTPGDTFTEADDVESCGATAEATDRDDSGDPERVRVSLRCGRDALEELGFDEDMADMIEDTLGRRTFRYLWRESDADD